MSVATPPVHWLSEVPRRSRRVALGSFDGVHVGHRRVIARADTVVTFSPHPRVVVGEEPVLLQDLERKVELLGRLGISEVVLIPFDRHLAAMSPADFMSRVLVDELCVEEVSVGANFRFGQRGAGTVADLAADRRFETRVEPLLVREGDVVSSSRIRALIEAGELGVASRLLGDSLEVHCSLTQAADDGRFEVAWPEGIVRPCSGTYGATVRAALGDAVPAEVSFSADGVWLLPWASLPGVAEPVSMALGDHAREAVARR